MERVVRYGGEVLSMALGAGLAGIACCGVPFVPWLAQVVSTVVGVAGLVFLVQYEAPLALVVAASSYAGWRLSSDRRAKAAQATLAVVALLTAALRLAWELDRRLVLGVEPLYWLFVLRQTLLAVLAALAIAVRVALLLDAAARRVCPCGPVHRGEVEKVPEGRASARTLRTSITDRR